MLMRITRRILETLLLFVKILLLGTHITHGAQQLQPKPTEHPNSISKQHVCKEKHSRKNE
jgi:hypothetical protein